ncbi:MAG: hypothetical protein FJX65_04340 [Alphaproteobacteria bacterium]|nr:hypothetical protein [Alphaproteobacteria bacterium]
MTQEAVALPTEDRKRLQQTLDQALTRLFSGGKRITEVRLSRSTADRIGIPINGSMYKGLRLVTVAGTDHRALLTYED